MQRKYRLLMYRYNLPLIAYIKHVASLVLCVVNGVTFLGGNPNDSNTNDVFIEKMNSRYVGQALIMCRCILIFRTRTLNK